MRSILAFPPYRCCLTSILSNPITIFAIYWAVVSLELPVISPQEDHFKFLLTRLLESSKTDPFDSEALMLVTPLGQYQLYRFPGCVSPKYEISILQFETLLNQREWQITWHHQQLEELCSARLLYFSQQIEDVQGHVLLWVTDRAEDLEWYLYAKLGAITRLLNYPLLDLKPGGSHCVIGALHTAIHQGGEVIALLSEHDCYHDGHQPWIRDRFKKLVIVEKWLTEVIKLLLIQKAIDVVDLDIMNELCQHARNHNARTLCVWMRAMRVCAEDHPQFSRFKMNIAISETHSETTQSDEQEEQESDRQWETEDSEGAGSESDVEEVWETEEEWEEGYMLETVVERKHNDEKNPQINGEECPQCHNVLDDYDERYWPHVYSRLIGSDTNTASPGHSK